MWSQTLLYEMQVLFGAVFCGVGPNPSLALTQLGWMSCSTGTSPAQLQGARKHLSSRYWRAPSQRRRWEGGHPSAEPRCRTSSSRTGCRGPLSRWRTSWAEPLTPGYPSATQLTLLSRCHCPSQETPPCTAVLTGTPEPYPCLSIPRKRWDFPVWPVCFSGASYGQSVSR